MISAPWMLEQRHIFQKLYMFRWVLVIELLLAALSQPAQARPPALQIFISYPDQPPRYVSECAGGITANEAI